MSRLLIKCLILCYYSFEFLMENEHVAREKYFQIIFGIHLI